MIDIDPKKRFLPGDLWSGKMVIVCLDYHNYVIAWGCAKESIQTGICDDYWYSVNTRKPKISQKYVDEINQKLHKLWGTSLSEMVLIPQNNRKYRYFTTSVTIDDTH